MKLSLICEANEEKLAFQTIELIGKAHGGDTFRDYKKLHGQVWTSDFFTAPKRGTDPEGLRGEGAGMEKDDLRACFTAGLIVSAEGGNWKLSDKAFKLAGIDIGSGGGHGSGGGRGPGFMQQAPGWNKLMSAFGK